MKEHSSSWFATIKEPRARKVLGAGIVALLILLLITLGIVGWEKMPETFAKGNAIWTLVALIISSPVAFIIWHFRDENARQQIENQRKDTNLKEFQKIAEWVSGAHFQEEKEISKHSKKTTYEPKDSNDIKSTETNTETSTERFVPHQNTALPTFSKRDGAIGLQIAAVYNLLPFYRGDHGESFQKPAVNLLTAAWLVLQQQHLQALIETQNNEERKKIIKQLQERAKSPLGIALTRVLLATDLQRQLLIRQHPEIFPNLCLAGMDLTLAGLAYETLRDQLFAQNNKKERWKAEGIQLQGVRFIDEMNFKEVNLIQAVLSRANLRRADLRGAKLIKTQRLINIKECENIWGAITTQATLQSQKISDDERQVLQAQSLIILVESTAPNAIVLDESTELKCRDTVNAKTVTHKNLWLDLDLAATQQLNPQWDFEIITNSK